MLAALIDGCRCFVGNDSREDRDGARAMGWVRIAGLVGKEESINEALARIRNMSNMRNDVGYG